MHDDCAFAAGRDLKQSVGFPYFTYLGSELAKLSAIYLQGATDWTLSLLDMEPLALDAPLRRVGYAEIVCDMLPRVGFAEFSRPAQVDRYGNTNNVVIGDYAQPKLRFPGVGGVSDFSPYESHRAFLYVPRHDRRTFVESLRVFSHLANVGDAKSLVIHPASTTHSRMDAEALRAAGVSEGLVRLSIGLEDPADLIEDLSKALYRSQK